MANSLNVTTLLGLVGRDPKYFPSDGEKQSMAIFPIGVEFYSKRNQKSELDWFDVKVFGPLAEYVRKYVVKNRKFGATGRLQNRKWKEDDVTHYRVELVADHIVPCDNKIPDYHNYNNDPISNTLDNNNPPISNTSDNNIPF